MKSFKSWLEEKLNYGHRDEQDTDSKLVFMAVKDHLRNKHRFKRLKSGEAIHAKDLWSLSPEMREKHTGLTIHFHHGSPDGTEDTVKGQYRGRRHKYYLWGPRKSAIHVGHMASMHPDHHTDEWTADHHKMFHKELHKNFTTFHHEFQHYHDHVRGPDDFEKKGGGKTDWEKYINKPAEVRARVKEFDHDAEKTMRLHPHKFKKLGHILPGFHDPTHHEGSVLRVSKHTAADTHFSTYHSMTDENKKHYHAIVDKYHDKYVKPHYTPAPVPMTNSRGKAPDTYSWGKAPKTKAPKKPKLPKPAKPPITKKKKKK